MDHVYEHPKQFDNRDVDDFAPDWKWKPVDSNPEYGFAICDGDFNQLAGIWGDGIHRSLDRGAENFKPISGPLFDRSYGKHSDAVGREGHLRGGDEHHDVGAVGHDDSPDDGDEQELLVCASGGDDDQISAIDAGYIKQLWNANGGYK